MIGLPVYTEASRKANRGLGFSEDSDVGFFDNFWKATKCVTGFHDWSEWSSYQCLRTRRCKDCGGTETEARHNWSPWKYQQDEDRHKPENVSPSRKKMLGSSIYGGCGKTNPQHPLCKSGFVEGALVDVKSKSECHHSHSKHRPRKSSVRCDENENHDSIAHKNKTSSASSRKASQWVIQKKGAVLRSAINRPPLAETAPI